MNLSREERTKVVKAFCDKMKQLGYDCGVYANPDYLNNKFNDVSGYPLWLARYSNEKGNYNCYMWQYTSKGKVSGISGNVDMNYSYEEVVKSDLPDLTGFVGVSIVSALNSKGYKSTFAYRKSLWKQLGKTETYKGTAEQNKALIVLLGGKLKTDIPSLNGYKGFSIVEGLKKFGFNSSFKYRAELWKKIGKTSTYKGSALQNIELLNFLKSI